MRVGIHISHEAAQKIGGIGAVLSGLCNSNSYLSQYEKTIFYGPLFDDTSSKNPQRLGQNSVVYYSSLDENNGSYPELKTICDLLHIDIVYGQKKIFDEINPAQSVDVEIVLVGIKRLKIDALNRFKFQLWEKFDFRSELYDDWDCEQYIRIAVPFNDIIRVLYPDAKHLSVFAHEYMGIPCCLNLLLLQRIGDYQNTETGSSKNSMQDVDINTYFYAHEVSTARSIVEKIPGHDLTFYNLLNRDLTEGVSMEERFGSQKHNYRNELIKLAIHFDKILAVGDWVKEEYRYLINHKPDEDKFEDEDQKIKIVYNGIPTNNLSYEDKDQSRCRLCSYCETLLNYSPDIIFTHVTRLVVSKGLWRDIRFLEEMDKYFSENKMKGFYILLSSLIATGRSAEDIYRIEKEYGWPLLHKEEYPDLLDYEKDIYASLSLFNAKSRSIKGVFINQYGFNREVTGLRLPEGTQFSDLRYGSDVELGFSIYEPFGIAQIENVPYGGMAYLTRQCGCSFLLEKSFQGADIKPFHLIDFSCFDIIDSEWQEEDSSFRDRLLSMTSSDRGRIESEHFKFNGEEMFRKLPKNGEDRKRMFLEAKKYADQLSWENNVNSIWGESTDN